MPHVSTLIVATKTLTLVLGALITYFSVKAYRRTGDRGVRALALGFGIVTVGAVLGGVVDIILGVSLLWGIAIQSALTAAGFAVITYSLYTR